MKQVLILLSAVTVVLSSGDGRAFHSKKTAPQKAPSQYASVAAFHSNQPVAAAQYAPQPHSAPQAVQPSPYSFGYEGEGSSRQESADASGKVTGQYSVTNEDGSIRIVKYVADENGFRADIDTNEAGTKSSNPANVAVKSAFVEPPAPVSAPQKYAAPQQAYAVPQSYGNAQAAQFEQKPIQFSQNQDNGAYSFNYEAQLEDGGSSARSESGDGSGKVSGYYSLGGADGRRRQVDYSSGSEGFQAKIETNEFGTKSDSPANVQFYSSAAQQGQSAGYGAKTSSFQSQKQATQYSASPLRQQAIQANAHQYDNKPSPYAFSYDAQLDDGSSSRTESADGSGKVVGSYSLSGADGRQRTIDYVADHDGFRATVNTNEFGTKSDSPADAQFYSSAPLEEPAAPKYSAVAQKRVPAAFPVEQSPLKSAGFSSGYQSQAASSSQYQGQSAIQYNAAAQEQYAPYAFNYLAELDDGSSSRTESGDASGKVVGSYSLGVEDGRQRTVDYSADHNGFRASVNTNEFGTKSDSPADVQFYSSAVQEPAFEPVRAAPVQAAYKPAHAGGHFMSAQQFSGSTGQYSAPHATQQKVEPEPSYQPSPYSFSYDAEATGGSSARSESSDASGKVTGSYMVQNEDGSLRVVEYIADKDGFRANVKTNEPGTKSDSPADVMVKSEAPQYSAPVEQQKQRHSFKSVQQQKAPSSAASVKQGQRKHSAAAPAKKQQQQSHGFASSSASAQQQQPVLSKANFPARSFSQKSSMVSQKHIDAFSR